MSARSEDFEAGVELTTAIMRALTPVVDGQPMHLVFEATAAALMAIIAQCGADAREGRLLLHKYAERILDFAADID